MLCHRDTGVQSREGIAPPVFQWAGIRYLFPCKGDPSEAGPQVTQATSYKLHTIFNLHASAWQPVLDLEAQGPQRRRRNPNATHAWLKPYSSKPRQLVSQLYPSFNK